MPIYELGVALIAIQRIIHKSVLYESGRLEKGASLKPRERELAALQIVSHRKTSDAWGLGTYLTNPEYGPIIQNIIGVAIVALSAYVWKKITRNEDPPKNQILIVNIFPEIKSLTDRIGNIGGVDGIEISSSQNMRQEPLLITDETQRYIREIQNDSFPGNPCEVTGYITRLYPKSFHLELEDSPRHYVRISMSEELFDRIRIIPVINDRKFTFAGIPYYKLGDTDAKFSEFRAEQIMTS